MGKFPPERSSPEDLDIRDGDTVIAPGDRTIIEGGVRLLDQVAENSRFRWS